MKLGKPARCEHCDYFRIISVKSKKGEKVCRALHKVFVECVENRITALNKVIDHDDGKKINNSHVNLRETTNLLSSHNKPTSTITADRANESPNTNAWRLTIGN